MPTRLPFDQLLVPVRQIGARHHRIAARALCQRPAVPAAHANAQRIGRRCRTARCCAALYARKVRKAGDSFHLRVGPQAETLLVVACLADEASTFERLQAAGKLARSALDGDPQSLLLWQQGCAAQAADAALNAAVAALAGGRVSLRHLQEQAESTRRRLARIDIARAAKLPDLDLTSRPPPATISRAG